MHYRVHQVLNAEATSLTCSEHGLNFFAICEANGRGGGVEDEVFENVFGELTRVGGEEVFEFVDVAERLAGGEIAGSIDGLADEVGVRMPGRIDAGDFLSTLHATITIPPCAHDVEVLQREADGIKLCVA